MRSGKALELAGGCLKCSRMVIVYLLFRCHRKRSLGIIIVLLKMKIFVCQEVSKLLSSGAIAEVERDDLMVCNPLGVVRNSAHKPRLIVDLRYVNKHLRSCKFKYEDIRTAADLFSKGDWFFKFAYKSGYHHIEIFPQHCQFLGFSLYYQDQPRYFHFTVLPFGLSTGPFLLTKIQRALVKH